MFSEKTKAIGQLAISAIGLIGGIIVIIFVPEGKDWAFGMIGLIVGYWVH